MLPPAYHDLTYRDDLAGPHLAPVHALLRDIFAVDVAPLLELGLNDPTYRAFCYLDPTGVCAANAAACPVPAMGIQSVTTRPAWRHRGLSHALVTRALHWCATQSPLTFLMTPIPDFYAPFGFRTVRQFAYAGPAPAPASQPASARRMDLAAHGDRRLLADTLRHRVPVSRHFAVTGAADAFALNLLDAAGMTAWHLAPLAAIVVTAAGADGMLQLIDIAAPSIPTLAEILAALGASPPQIASGASPPQIEVLFPPDRLAWTGVPVPHHPSETFMVRGDLPPLAPFMLPPTARF
jgi:GNAT superfamily N-acetyltransferase